MRVLLALALASTLAACASKSTTSSSNQRSSAAAVEPTYVKVENRSFTDMNIYVIRSAGQRIRLGMVSGASNATFQIPQSLLFGTTALRFLADPIGSSRTPVSDEIGIRPGDTVTLTIPPQ
ncbi:MAG TPA: hypothetical protein VJ672_06385 [Gemmatimonadaceae bacterium]|nr:hypothetical protein [Gemmatimonadaceae bacterium]